MPKLTAPAIERCANIARAIDAEMEKDPSQRKSIFIRTTSPKSLKAELAAYKTTFKQEWKASFWMFVYDSRSRGTGDHPVHGRCIEISFAQGGTRRVAYEIVQDSEDKVEIFHSTEGPLSLSSFTMAKTQELDDANAAMFILVENPINMKLRMEFLSDETKAFLSDPQNNDPSALVNMLIKRGYTFDVRGEYLWVWRGDA